MYRLFFTFLPLQTYLYYKYKGGCGKKKYEGKKIMLAILSLFYCEVSINTTCIEEIGSQQYCIDILANVKPWLNKNMRESKKTGD